MRINVVTLADARQKRLTSSVTICVVPLSNGQKFTCLAAHLFPADAKDRAAVKARQGRGGLRCWITMWNTTTTVLAALS